MSVVLTGENLTLERLKAVAVDRERVEIPPRPWSAWTAAGPCARSR